VHFWQSRRRLLASRKPPLRSGRRFNIVRH
jgi:hypothetical protein